MFFPLSSCSMTDKEVPCRMTSYSMQMNQICISSTWGILGWVCSEICCHLIYCPMWGIFLYCGSFIAILGHLFLGKPAPCGKEVQAHLWRGPCGKLLRPPANSQRGPEARWTPESTQEGLLQPRSSHHMTVASANILTAVSGEILSQNHPHNLFLNSCSAETVRW